jgi:predicted MFS family arabinose efflux permease
VIAYLTAAYVLGPMVAPPIGGQLTAVFGWRALFVLASAVGLLVILAVIFGVLDTVGLVEQPDASSRQISRKYAIVAVQSFID